MIDVFVESAGNCLHMQFPMTMDELAAQFGSIGIRQDLSKMPAYGNEEIRVTMESMDETGETIIAQIGENDSLGDVNQVSIAISRACSYGKREFLDMLSPKPGGDYEFYKNYDHIGPSGKTGIEGLLEETMRYTAMMLEYERVCREEQDEEYER